MLSRVIRVAIKQMQNIQEIFIKMREMKKEQKDLKEMYKDALAQADEYEEIVEQMKQLREKKKQIETRIQAEMGKAWEKLDDIKFEMETNKEMMTDIAMTTLMKGGRVEVKDEYENPYEPVFKVNFKKAEDGQTAE
ncbi:MAG: hypothetical protein UY41_C0011G0019 [Candidatus Moranbacteria bacterium GW2011_GWE1_49_15]|nr:MAG: hypothetical protein UY41_C0011G0019 [Candidatus Moranbacteria bacterium GW2011_GWE1_49_15]